MAHLYFGNSLRAWTIALVVAVVVYLALLGIRALLVSRIGALAKRTDAEFDDAVVDLISRTRWYFMAAIAVGIARRGLVLPADLTGPVDGALELLGLVQVGVWFSGLVAFYTTRSMSRRGAAADRLGIAAIRAMGVAARVVAWAVLVLVALQFVFDKNITALITVGGVGGIALALAVQNILGDVLAAFAIVFDKPFDVGDFIVVDSVAGSVQQIGLKTTRVASISGEQIIVSNSDLLKSRIHNYARMTQRRVVFTLNVTYDTPPDVMARVPGMIRRIIESQAPVKFDRSHFSAYADSWLSFESVYYVLSADYNVYMDIQQAIYLEVLRQFEREGIEFAFPSRTIYTVPPVARAT
jgi:small-conductance mechanosensitive channel